MKRDDETREEFSQYGHPAPTSSVMRENQLNARETAGESYMHPRARTHDARVARAREKRAARASDTIKSPPRIVGSSIQSVAELSKNIGLVPLRGFNPFGTVDDDENNIRVVFAKTERKEHAVSTDFEALKVAHLLGEAAPDLVDAYADVRRLILNSVAPLTRKKYRYLYRRVVEHCESLGLAYLPMHPKTVALVVTDMLKEGLAPSYVSNAVTVISMAHRYAGYDDPTRDPAVRSTMAGGWRVFGRPSVGKAPLLPRHLLRLYVEMRKLPNKTQAVRDFALLLVSFFGALRRSEATGIDFEHIRRSEDGEHVTIFLPTSKTDRRRCGQFVVISRTGSELCPVTALDRWIRLCAEQTGPVFRRVSKRGKVFGGRMSTSSVARIVKAHVALLGLPTDDYAGHSMRAGFITAGLGCENVRDSDVMRQARQRDPRITIGYYRPPEPPNLTRAMGF